MRKAAHQRRIETHAVEHETGVLDPLGRRDKPVRDRRLADDVDDAHAGVERRVRILEDHLHLELLPPRRRGGQPRQRDPAPVALAGGQRQQADGEAAQRRLAAAGFPDEPDDLAGRDCKVDTVDGVHDLLAQAGAERVADPRRHVERPDEALRDALQLGQGCDVRLHRLQVVVHRVSRG